VIPDKHIFARNLLGLWCRVKITQADAQTIQMDATSAIPIIFMLDALPATTLQFILAWESHQI